MLGQCPEARQVVVRGEAYDVPSLAEYRSGARPHWQATYEGIFTREPANEEGD
jgi:hypothetical protein